MAKITKLEFEVSPGSSIDTLLLVVKTTLRFTDFDRPTRLEYVLTHRLFGVSGGRLRHRPPEAAGTSPITPDGLDLDLDLEIEAATELQSFSSIRFRAAGSSDPPDGLGPIDLSDLLVVELDDGTRLDEFEIARTTADEDSAEHDPDELQIRAELVPDLPAAATVFSNVVRASI